MEAIAREMAQAHTHYQALLNERGTAAMPTSLKMTCGALGFKVMDPFDYQRWQMWSQKARHTFDVMAGDSKKTLTKTKHNYQNLERETLGTIWGMEKLHFFLYGKEFTLETGHKPLVSINKKHMIDISPRVQRLIVRSFPCLPFKVVYKNSVDILVADALSCVTPIDPEDNIKLPIIAIIMITTRILMSTDCQGSFSNKLE